MQVGQAEVRYSHCAERQRLHFQIEVYKTYERAMALGTGRMEGEGLSMKNAEPTRPEGTQPISDSGPEDPPIKSELLVREGGGGCDLIVG